MLLSACILCCIIYIDNYVHIVFVRKSDLGVYILLIIYEIVIFKLICVFVSHSNLDPLTETVSFKTITSCYVDYQPVTSHFTLYYTYICVLFLTFIHCTVWNSLLSSIFGSLAGVFHSSRSSRR